jgi:glycosyltransferase involved in cell wall biosynthesis
VHWHVLRVYPFFWLLPAKKVVVTIHDAGVYVLPGVNTISTRLFRLNLRLFRRRISSIVVVSETAKLELISVAPWFKNQIEVMPLATRICKASPKRPPNLNGTQRYILCVSRWQPHKNILTFLLAYQEARVELGKKCPALIVVGKPRNDHDEDSKRIIGILNEVSTKTIHEVSESELSFLHRNSLFSIFPSLHEGFGLAVLESMVSGKMVLVHEGTATSEVLNIGELSINMRDTKAIKESIIKFSSDDKLLSEYAQLAKANSERYSWQKSALAIQNIYLKRPSC